MSSAKNANATFGTVYLSWHQQTLSKGSTTGADVFRVFAYTLEPRYAFGGIRSGPRRTAEEPPPPPSVTVVLPARPHFLFSFSIHYAVFLIVFLVSFI